MKMLLGTMFIVSAVSKFITVDTFEIYVYSFGLLPLTLSFYAARVVIALELLLGTALISNRHHRFTSLMTLLFLLIFIVFLSYAHLVGRTDSCHCFGELISFNPIQSILKNAVLVVAMLFVYRFAAREWIPRWWLVLIAFAVASVFLIVYMVHSLRVLDQYALVLIFVMSLVGVLASFKFYSRWYVTLALVLTPFVAVFILTPPDSWFYTGTHERYNEELFYETVGAEDSAFSEAGLEEGRHVVAFFSPTCGYCQLAAGKLTTIVERGELDCDKVLYVFPIVKKQESYDHFYEESRSGHYNEVFIDKETFIKITQGAFPIVLLVEDGDVKVSFAYRNINEQIVKRFLIGDEDY